MLRSKKNLIKWKTNLPPIEWDNLLALSGGHFLQSAKWGDARKKVDGIDEIRFAAFKEEVPIFLARCEKRKIFRGLIQVAWVPRGPLSLLPGAEAEAKKLFLNELRKTGFFVCFMNGWKRLPQDQIMRSSDFTIWINFDTEIKNAWMKLDKQCRNDINRAKKAGIYVEISDDKNDIFLFFQLCHLTSLKKGFRLNTSFEMMALLLINQEQSLSKAYLFVARYEKKLVGGAFIFVCGNRLHYLWGAIDHESRKFCVGELLQWHIIEWAISHGLNLYDLEGIDPKNNPGTYQFKKKWGGEVVALPGRKIYLL